MGNPPKSLNVMAKGGQPIYYDKLMLGCEEKTLRRVLPPTKLFSNKATGKLFNLIEHFSTQANCLCSYLCSYLASKMPYAMGVFKSFFASSFVNLLYRSDTAQHQTT